MPYTPQQLKEKLLNSLDKNQHVVDVRTVLDVIGILEKYPISRHALETTRLGRIVNDIRKQTSDKDIAKRAKSLVRKWQELVMQPSTSSSQPSSLTSSPALQLVAASSPATGGSSSVTGSKTSSHAHVANGSRNDIVNKRVANVKSGRLNGGSSPSLPGYRANGERSSGSPLASSSLSVTAAVGKIRSAESSPVLPVGAGTSLELKRSQTTPHSLNNSLGKSHNGYHPKNPSKLAHPSTPELVSAPGRPQSVAKQKDGQTDTRTPDSLLNSSKPSAPRSQSSVAKSSQASSSKTSASQSKFPATVVEPVDKNCAAKSNRHLASEPVAGCSSSTLEQRNTFMISDDVRQSEATDSLKLKIKRARTDDLGATSSHMSVGKVGHTAGKNGLVSSPACEAVRTQAKSNTPTSITPSLSKRNTPTSITPSLSKSNTPTSITPSLSKSNTFTSITPSLSRVQSTDASRRNTGSPGPSAALSKSNTPTSITPSLSKSNTFTSITPSLSRVQSTDASRRNTGSPGPSAASSRVVPRKFEHSASKVATTSELIQKLYSDGNLRIVASETLERIATNQISREIDSDSSSSTTPKGKSVKRKADGSASDTRPTGRLKKRARMDEEDQPGSLERGGARMSGSMLNWFKQLAPEPTAEEVIAATNMAKFRPMTKSANQSDWVKASSQALIPSTSHSSSYVSPQTSNDSLDPYHLLPPLDPDQIDWNSLEYEARDPSLRPPVCDADVERLQSGQWSGVNGQYDYRNEWHDWTQTYSMKSYEDSVLHILPYVSVDEY